MFTTFKVAEAMWNRRIRLWCLLMECVSLQQTSLKRKLPFVMNDPVRVLSLLMILIFNEIKWVVWVKYFVETCWPIVFGQNNTIFYVKLFVYFLLIFELTILIIKKTNWYMTKFLTRTSNIIWIDSIWFEIKLILWWK